ncbi:MAG: hypothetical protein L3J06_09260 [Cyclobacteriaceae bacterium]|nr:hypothetical protein [Cyclobacteriaceae bacterium]
MKIKLIYRILLLLIMLGFSTIMADAQNLTDEASAITLTGKVNCVHPINGTLSLVIVFNKSQGYGAVSKQDGSFSIKMNKSDTIVFSTAEHQDYVYYLSEIEKFKDHSIDVIMVTDAIWLNTVTVIGVKSLEQFKQEILSLDIPQGNVNLGLPVVSKYAKQLATGDGETDLIGPLTYLQHKFNRYNKLKKKVNQ